MKGDNRESYIDKITKAVTEMAKGMKAVSFYPESHPSLIKILQKICQLIDDVPPPEGGIEISVSKPSLTVGETKLPEKHDAISDFRNALFVRRTNKLILLPGVTIDETRDFLHAISLDPDEIMKKGGLERILIGMRISKIWINRVDYQKLMEELKKEKDSALQENDHIIFEKVPVDTEMKIEEDDIDSLLSKLAQTAESGEYRDTLHQILKKIDELIRKERLLQAEKAIKIFSNHTEYPPGGSEDIKDLAITGIKELVDEDIIDLYVKKFGSKSLQERVEAQTVLLIIGEAGVAKILAALADEKNLIVRKAMVDLVTKIGDPAIPYVVKNLNDKRWYVIRNMITILGEMGKEEVAQHIANTLKNPDPRVKKEAIKALSKIQSTISITALGECCFDADENIATISVAALGTKKDDTAIQILKKRFGTRKFVYPDYRISREIIDSLKKIGTEKAVFVLQNIALYNPLFKTKKMKELKMFAVQGIGKIKSEKAREALENLTKGSDSICRKEAAKILERLGHGKDGA